MVYSYHSGWDDGVATMSKGERAKLVISPDFAYGASGVGDMYVPSSHLDQSTTQLQNNHTTTTPRKEFLCSPPFPLSLSLTLFPSLLPYQIGLTFLLLFLSF